VLDGGGCVGTPEAVSAPRLISRALPVLLKSSV
jgi:hypothetical protein